MSGSRMKWIAIVTMLIDHIGASIVEYYLRITDWSVMPAGAYDTVDMIDTVLRSIGRLAFPIFIFLLVEGFYHTRSRLRYLMQMVIFALISDIPFDLAIFLSNAKVRKGIFWTLDHQNVFFTLALGLLGMILAEKLYELCSGNMTVTVIGFILILTAMNLAAYYMHTDYKSAGVTAIMAAYAIKKWGIDTGKVSAKVSMIVVVIILTIMSSTSEICAIVDAAIAERYDGSRGKTISKWFFYIFYPAHLFVLFLIRYCLFP